MCGIVGIIDKDSVHYNVLEVMIEIIRHRGPDDMGFYVDKNVGLGHSRLSIIDPENGKQPITNERQTIVVVFNGEIYNHLALRKDLIGKGHLLKNNSDTAILPHMYEEYGLEMFKKLNGQFAIAIWDKLEKKLILSRDRFGEKPLYYYHKCRSFCFASEAKAIFKSGLVNAVISPAGLKQVFTYWTPTCNNSVFENIHQVPPGCYLVYKDMKTDCYPYWRLSYSTDMKMKQKYIEDISNELENKLMSAVKTRMMSDVPISFYLSGGLDSSLITGIAARLSNQRLNTFSISFDDSNFDESIYQNHMAHHLETNHQRIIFSRSDIPSMLRKVIFHTEVPLLRSGAFPMFVLARLVRSNNTKVVLSGEGSDELFGGYDIFKEAKVREFCSRNPNSKFRTALYKRINNFVKGLSGQSANSLSLFYNDPKAPSWASSHYSRWKLGLYSQQFFSAEYRQAMEAYDEIGEMINTLPAGFMTWTSLQRAQYLEVVTLFSGYLLSSQGDRVSMASSVECRYPFLDYELVDFANSLPDTLKIRGLNEKFIIKKLAQKYVPDLITKRTKFPYRAPINIVELMKDEYVRYITSTAKFAEFGVFNPDVTERFLKVVQAKSSSNERDCMLFMGILTTQILLEQFTA